MTPNVLNRQGGLQTSSVTVRVPIVTVADGKLLADRAGVSFSRVVNAALVEYLSKGLDWKEIEDDP